MPKPKILKRLVSQLERKGMPEGQAIAVATKKLQEYRHLKPGTQQATAKGKARGEMTAKERAIDRASKDSGHRKSEYTYSSKTNRATLKRR